MKIEHLKYVMEAVRCGSINRAARNLFFSQSNLSIIIKNIELELGYPILDRTKEGVVPTSEGVIFLKCAQKIISEYETMLAAPSQLKESSNISILCSRSPFVMECFFQFRKKGASGIHGDIFQELGIRSNVDAIIANKGRIGIVAILKRQLQKYQEMADSYDLDLEILLDNIPLVVIMNQNHELACRKAVNIAELSQYPFVADLDVDYDDTLKIFDITDLGKVLYVTDRASTYDAIQKENYITTILGIDIPDAEQHHCIGRVVEDCEDGMLLFWMKRKDTKLNQREINFLNFLKNKLGQIKRRVLYNSNI